MLLQERDSEKEREREREEEREREGEERERVSNIWLTLQYSCTPTGGLWWGRRRSCVHCYSPSVHPGRRPDWNTCHTTVCHHSYTAGNALSLTLSRISLSPVSTKTKCINNDNNCQTKLCMKRENKHLYIMFILLKFLKLL